MKFTILILMLALLMVGGGVWLVGAEEPMTPQTGPAPQGLKKAVFAGGCFWCVESDFEKLEGVSEVISGYTGGRVANPGYKQVSAGGTGHLEAVEVIYDPRVVTYEKLLDYFWRHVNPTDPGGQFVDRGAQYRTAIFYHTQEEKEAAEASKRALDASGVLDKPVATEILPAGPFYRAEEYHQDYYKKSKLSYKFYRYNSGRDQFIEKTWKDHPGPIAQAEGFVKPGDAQLKERLTPMQYKVTQHEGTEPPFKNEYWDNKEEGIYVDIVSGEPLFDSTRKYKSGTGWPSFWAPLEPGNIVTKKDRKLFTVRTEVRSRLADSHLGHVFDDGPPPTGLRYCMNSAALRFIPRQNLEKEGYGQYLKLFE